MTHEEKLQIDLLWYQAMEGCVKEDSVRYAFAALVRADEREQCAKVCDVRSVEDGWEGCYADACAAAIRARGQG